LKKSFRQEKFAKINERARDIILSTIQNCNGPVQVPFIRERLLKGHGIKLSTSLIRGYLRENLGLRYRVLGVVGQRYDDHVTLLKRQTAASWYIDLLKKGVEVINIDESIIRSTDQRRRGWTLPKNRILVSKALRLP
jgi:hypothetical protein